MIGLSRRVRVFAYTRPVDMRKQYDGLYSLVVDELKADPLSGDLFLFTNRHPRARSQVPEILTERRRLTVGARRRKVARAYD